jgi:hypothetical protein
MFSSCFFRLAGVEGMDVWSFGIEDGMRFFFVYDCCREDRLVLSGLFYFVCFCVLLGSSPFFFCFSGLLMM